MTGISTPFGGVQWEVRDGDREIARRVVSILEDRRMLWVDHAYEVPSECAYSASKTRDALTEQIATKGIGTELSALLKEMRRLFANFMTVAPRARLDRHAPYGADPFSAALGALRAAIGERLAVLVATCKLDVDDELKAIIPDSGAWFFTHFSGPAPDPARG